MLITFIVLIAASVFFVWGKIRSDIVGLCALVVLMFGEILTPEEALSGFSNSIVIMMIGLFVVGGAIFQTGLAKMISSRLLKMSGNSELWLFVFTFLGTAVIGAFVSNTGTVALMLPITVSLAMSANMNVGRLLMPMAFASSMGGMTTLIGTPPNLVIQNLLQQAGYEGFSFFSFAPVGFISIAVGLFVLIPLSRWFLSRKSEKEREPGSGGKTLRELVKEYSLAENLYRAAVVESSLCVGKKLSDLEITRRYQVSVLEIRRRHGSNHRFLKTAGQEMAGPNTELQVGDVVYLSGDFTHVEQLISEYRLKMVDTHRLELAENTVEQQDFTFTEIGIAELIVMSGSRLVNQPIGHLGFRSSYGVNVLGIQRKRSYILRDLKNQKVQANDILLVQGMWADIGRMSKNTSDWVVVGQPLEEAAKVTLDHKAPIAGTIMLLMIVAMTLGIVPSVTAVMVAALLMVLTGCFRNVEAAYKTINWESVVLIASMLPMSSALEKTGASAIVSETLVNGLGDYGPMVLLAGIYFTTSLLTMFISNTATAVLLAPIAMQSAVEIGVSPYPFVLAVAVAASMCFASPFSTPPNALVMPAGHYTFMDYVKVGLPLQVVMGVVMILLLPVLFPF